jgi:hypothetical protein
MKCPACDADMIRVNGEWVCTRNDGHILREKEQG